MSTRNPYSWDGSAPPTQQGGAISPNQVGPAQSNYVTRDQLDDYIRGEAFRSIMKNQNADLYAPGKWRDFPEFTLYTAVAPWDKPVLSEYYTGSTSTGTVNKPSSSCRWTRIGDTVFVNFSIQFGDGLGGTSGAFCINVPVLPTAAAAYGNATGYSQDVYARNFIGDVYCFNGSGIDAKGPIGWLHPAFIPDTTNGAALSSGKVYFVYGQQMDTTDAELWEEQWLLGPDAAKSFPNYRSVISGQLMYEAKAQDVLTQK